MSLIYPGRVFLVLTNVLFLLLSVVGLLLGLLAFSGTLQVVNEDHESQSLRSVTGYLLCVCSAFCFAVSICGCMGSLFNIRVVLCTYIIILTVLVMTGAFGMAYLHMKDGNDKSYVERALEATLRHYNETEDRIHKPNSARFISHLLSCCGLEGPQDFLNGKIFWYRDARLREVWTSPLPYACCVINKSCEISTQEVGRRLNDTYTQGCLEAAQSVLDYLREGLIYLFICCSILEIVLIWLAGQQCLRENLDNIFEQVHVREVPVRGKREAKKSVQGAGDMTRRGAIDLGTPHRVQKKESVPSLLSSHMNLAVTEVRARGGQSSAVRPKGITALVPNASPTASTWTKLRYFGNETRSRAMSVNPMTISEEVKATPSHSNRSSIPSTSSMDSLITDASDYLLSVVDSVLDSSQLSYDDSFVSTVVDANDVEANISQLDQPEKHRKGTRSISDVVFRNLKLTSEVNPALAGESIQITALPRAESRPVDGLSNQTSCKVDLSPSQIPVEVRSAEFKSARPPKTLNTDQHEDQYLTQSPSKTPPLAATPKKSWFSDSKIASMLGSALQQGENEPNTSTEDNDLESLWVLLWPHWLARTERPCPVPAVAARPSSPQPCWRLATTDSPSCLVEAAALAPSSPQPSAPNSRPSSPPVASVSPLASKTRSK